MTKLLLLVLVPFMIISCGDEGDKQTHETVNRFSKITKQSFYIDSGKGINDVNHLRFDISTDENKIFLYEYDYERRGSNRIIQIREAVFNCKDDTCKTEVRLDEYEVISINRNYDEIFLVRFEVVEGGDDRELSRRRYLADDFGQEDEESL